MHVLLTSLPFSYDGPDRTDPRVNPANDFCAELRRSWPANGGTLRPATCVLVASDPDCPPMTDGMVANFTQAFAAAGFPVACMTPLDSRNDEHGETLLRAADVIILTGGHVPTQNVFFQRIGLARILGDLVQTGLRPLVIGISAGSMNAAAEVYAMPEEPGEAADPGFARFLPGLGLTDISVIPHYDALRDLTLDDLRCMEEIAYPDSDGRRFLVIPDGSYVSLQLPARADDQPRICGTAWWLEDGVMTPVGALGETEVASVAGNASDAFAQKLARGRELADQLGMVMQEDGEGTLFVRTYESALRDPQGVPLVSTMYGLYCAEPVSISKFHRLTCDETWCFFEGDPLELHLISAEGAYERVVLGGAEAAAGTAGAGSAVGAPRYQHTIPAGTWQAGRLVEGGAYALYSCVVTPSFHDGCYEGGTAQDLLALCSDTAAEAVIRDLT